MQVSVEKNGLLYLYKITAYLQSNNMTKQTVQVKFDNSTFCAAIDELKSAIIDSKDKALLKQRFNLLFEIPNFTDKLFTIETDTSTASASYISVTLHPSNCFLVLLAVVRS